MNCPFATMKKALRKVQLPSQLPPRPKGHRFLGILPGRRDWVRAFGDVLKEVGDVACCKYVGFPACVVGHPDQIADVLIVNAQSYTKSNMLRMLLGDGLATSEGELWRRQRNLLLPVFSKERLPEYGPIITRHIDRMMSSWNQRGAHDIYRDMMRLTLDVAAEAFLGVQLNGRQEILLECLGTVLDEFIVQADQCFLIPHWVPTRSNRAIRRAVKTILAIVDDIIRDRRAEIAGGATGKKDLLSVLLEAQSSGVPITDELVRDEATTFLLGGHETTAIGLAWVWHLLTQHPEVEQRLAEHLDAEMQGRPVRFEYLPRLTYLEQVVKESLRLFPPAWYATRRTDRDVELGNYRVPEGVTVVMNIWAVHHDPRFYPNPEAFRPERWTEEFTKGLHKFAYLPFGIGARRCIGSLFAEAETMLAVASIVQRFHVKAVPNAVVTPLAATTLRPGDGGVLVTVQARKPHLDTFAASRLHSGQHRAFVAA
jgi:cytochrome P450